MSRVAWVTGAPGWLGTRIVRALFSGLPEAPALAAFRRYDEVRCLVRRGEDTAPLRALEKLGRLTLIEGDVTDADSVEVFLAGAAGATVFHAAGVIHPARGVRELFAVNAEGTHRVVATAAKVGARRFVHVSSNSPLGVNDAVDEVFDEDAPYAPYLAYGRSKKLAEDHVNEAGASGALETVIIRPPWFFGPNQPARQTLFFKMIRDGGFPVLGSGAQRRSMAYVDDICQALLLADHVPAAAGHTYWIAGERAYPITEIVATVQDVLARDFGMKPKGRQLRLPGFVGDVAELVDRALQSVGLYHQKVHVLGEMNKTIACRIDKAKRELGYAPTVDLREGMRRSVAWVIEAYGGIDG